MCLFIKTIHFLPFICICHQAIDLEIDESSFTGETEPERKETSCIPEAVAHGSVTEQKNVAFMGTLVRCGKGKVSFAWFLNSLPVQYIRQCFPFSWKSDMMQLAYHLLDLCLVKNELREFACWYFYRNTKTCACYFVYRSSHYSVHY